MAWGRKTGGRKRGTPNKRTSVLAAKAEASGDGAPGEMPLDYMLRVMNDPATEPHRRDAMAKAAAHIFIHNSPRYITGIRTLMGRHPAGDKLDD
jgi:hypothetical protein